MKAEIAVIYHENKGWYGYRRITTELHTRNIQVNHKIVQQLMKELGLVCRVRAKKYRSYKGEVVKIVPNLLQRDFRADKLKVYLSPILDLYSSDLVNYTISDKSV